MNTKSWIISKSKIYFIVLTSLLTALMIGCMPSATVSIVNTPIPATIVDVSPIPDLVVTATDTPVITAVETAVPNKLHLQEYPSEILFNFGTIDDCASLKRAGIWISEYRSKSISSLLQSPLIDYLYPNWSLDGQWIAYVVSNPVQVSDPTEMPKETGTDSVWIMRSDGTMQKKISNDIPSLIIHSSINNSCSIESKIMPPLVWSPDGDHIILTQSTRDPTTSKFINVYYVTNVETGKSQLLSDDPVFSSAIWVNKDVIAISSEGVVKLVKDFDLNKPTISEIAYPTGIPAESEAFFSKIGDSENLIVSFRIGQTLISPKPTKIAIWKLNTTSGEWQNLTTIEKQTWGIPEIINKSVLLCEESQITIFDMNSWAVISTVTSDQLHTEWINCGLLRIVPQPIDNSLLMLLTQTNQTSKVEVKKITIPLQSANDLDISSVFFQLEEQIQVLDFSIAPNP